MTIIITKTKLAIAVLAMVLVGAGVAVAGDNDNPFEDVEDVGTADERFYSAPVEWLWDNSLTTGSPAGSNTFKPLDNVTRGEYATFNFRYDDLVVQPAVDALQAEIDALEAELAATPTLYWVSIDFDGSIRRAGPGVNIATDETQRINFGLYEVDFTAVANVSQCQAMVSVSDTGGLANTPRMISVVQRKDDVSSVYVAVRDADDIPVDAAFDLQLWCGTAVFSESPFVPTSESTPRP